MPPRHPGTKTIWYLEGAVDETGQIFRVPVLRLPFRVGREAGLELSLPSQVVSSLHAELSLSGEQLMVVDRESTNGTFVNKIPVEVATPLQDGDLLQFATLPFRVRMGEPERLDGLLSATAAIDTRQPLEIAENLTRLKELLETEAVTHLFQPIVRLRDRQIIGYEVLGRGAHDGLPVEIDELFRLAEPLGSESELSRVFRRQSLATCASLAGDHCFFLNTHPAELRDDSLLPSLRQARETWPDLRIAVEIHESSVTDVSGIRDLHEELQTLDMLLVYDDFGAGQARLMELAEVPPAYLKFDRGLIRKIDQGPEARIRLLEGLANLAHELDIRIIAEGLERPEELQVCRQLGFSYGQGYLLAEPRSCLEQDGVMTPPELEDGP